MAFWHQTETTAGGQVAQVSRQRVIVCTCGFSLLVLGILAVAGLVCAMFCASACCVGLCAWRWRLCNRPIAILGVTSVITADVFLWHAETLVVVGQFGSVTASLPSDARTPVPEIGTPVYGVQRNCRAQAIGMLLFGFGAVLLCRSCCRRHASGRRAPNPIAPDGPLNQ